MSNNIVVKKVETRTMKVELCNDDIIRVMFKRNTEIGALEFKELFERYNDIVEGRKYPYIYFAEDSSVVITSEGREYSKQNEHSFPKICNAYVVTSLAHKLVVNFYLKFNKPVYLSKVFSNMRDAETWCFQQCEKQ